VGDPLTMRRLPVPRTREIRELLARLNAPTEAYSLLDASIKSERTIVTDTPWEKVLRVADAVLVD
jgi:hypothetical protein